MRLRNQHDAVLVGINTVIADNPWLTSRIKGGRDPSRIVIDSRLRTPIGSYLLPKRKGPRTIIACSEDAPTKNEKALVAKGAEIWRLPSHANGRIDLHALAMRLGDEKDGKIQSVLVEGGGEIHEYFLRRRLADELVIYIAPRSSAARRRAGSVARASRR
jgi:diaminohydroxyphosphoribosylaminopyrimidine deaminase/5-amino-6-(5-phosphoribosylamino)uracil reductase